MSRRHLLKCRTTSDVIRQKLINSFSTTSGPFLEGYGQSAITFRNASDSGYETSAGYLSVNINGVT